MYNTTALDILPLWAIFSGSALLIIAAVEIGYASGCYKQRHMKTGQISQISAGVGATMGLLAFMLAFTFGAGTDRWDAKKAVTLNEANAVGTAFLRSDLLPEPERGVSRQLLADYMAHRVKIISEKLSMGRNQEYTRYKQLVEGAVVDAKYFHSELWQTAMSAASKQPSPMTSLYINALNEVIDIHEVRVNITVQQRMPVVFWIALYTLAFFSMALLGYEVGTSGGVRTYSAWIVAFSFATVMLLVVALDRPQTSSVGQFPMLEAQQDIKAAIAEEPRVSRAPPPP